MRITTAITALVVAGAVLSPVAPVNGSQRLGEAQAAVKCQGQVATLIGEPGGGTLRGTRGRDVIVSNGVSVIADAGNDLVCMTGTPRSGTHYVNAGNGNDRIVNNTGLPSSVQLRQGRDTFSGGSGTDFITADRDFVRRGPDRISAGAGSDVVRAVTTVEKGLLLRGGPGRDIITPVLLHPNNAKHLTINNRTGRATVGKTPFTVIGFEDFDLGAPRLTFIGRDTGEVVATTTTALAADLGGGNDQLRVEGTVRTTTRIRGGSGDDVLRMFTFDGFGPAIGRLDVDLTAGTLKRSGPGNYRTMMLGGFNDLDLTGYTMNIVGSSDDNEITLRGCRGSVTAEGGPDAVTWTIPTFETVPQCGDSDQYTLRGGDGDDYLVGGERDDILIGDAGTDIADGSDGTDACDAETTLRCESVPSLP